MAYRELVKLAQPGALNVIVLLTDGRPIRIQRDFPAANHRPPQYVYKYNSQGRSL